MNLLFLLHPKSLVAYLVSDCTARQGLEKMRAHGYTAIPVLNPKGEYIGTVSEGDFLWALVDDKECSLKKLEFGIIELGKEGELVYETKDRETAFIILGGKADFESDKGTYLGGNLTTALKNKTKN